jgi:hypothetical protein
MTSGAMRYRRPGFWNDTRSHLSIWLLVQNDANCTQFVSTRPHPLLRKPAEIPLMVI